MLNVIMLTVIMLNVIMLNVIMLSVTMLSVIMLNVIMLNFIMLNVILLNVIILNVNMLSVVAPKNTSSEARKNATNNKRFISAVKFKKNGIHFIIFEISNYLLKATTNLAKENKLLIVFQNSFLKICRSEKFVIKTFFLAVQSCRVS
jgi:hypothetical protein